MKIVVKDTVKDKGQYKDKDKVKVEVDTRVRIRVRIMEFGTSTASSKRLWSLPIQSGSRVGLRLRSELT